MLKKEEEMLVAVKERQAKVKKKLILISCILGLLFIVFFLSENVEISGLSCCLNLLII
jgi:hypothetical protein